MSTETLATKEQVETMLRVVGTRDQLAQFMENFKTSLAANLRLTKAETDKMYADVDTEKLLAAAVTVYQKHFTAEEVGAVIEFYSSPVGQSFIQKIFPVNQELHAACLKLFNPE